MGDEWQEWSVGVGVEERVDGELPYGFDSGSACDFYYFD